MKTDLFEYINCEVLFQLDKKRLLHFIAFFSKNLNPIRYNYKIYNKKLFAIICCFEQ